MSHNLGYMGTKAWLAPHIATIVRKAKPGILLDTFSGMCAVARRIGADRQIWTNDTQKFAACVARGLFTAAAPLPNLPTVVEALWPAFERNRASLLTALSHSVSAERSALGSGSYSEYLVYWSRTAEAFETEGDCALQALSASDTKYALFTRLYSESYLGLSQCIELDSIRCAIDESMASGVLKPGQEDLLLYAVGSAMRAVSTTTGHFAQFLSPKPSNFRRFHRQRSRGLWYEFIRHLDECTPLGNLRWRSGNRVFCTDSLALMMELERTGTGPSIVYADPPYTEDQYSRYYHLLDTLVLYDYPEVSWKGRYRVPRFQTPFSLATKVVEAFDQLVCSCRTIGADLIISYPTHGLLRRAGAEINDILTSHYPTVSLELEQQHLHSTLGASKGTATGTVTERLYWARG